MKNLKQILKHLFCRKNHRPEPLNERLVPISDFMLMKDTRLMWAKGLLQVSGSNTHVPESGYANAYILHHYYGMPKEDVLAETGYWVEDDPLLVSITYKRNHGE